MDMIYSCFLSLFKVDTMFSVPKELVNVYLKKKKLVICFLWKKANNCFEKWYYCALCFHVLENNGGQASEDTGVHDSRSFFEND